MDVLKYILSYGLLLLVILAALYFSRRAVSLGVR